jgi:dUTP pyrophosphatase
MKFLPLKVMSEKATNPKRGYKTDAGLDLSASEDVQLIPMCTKSIPTDIRICIPVGYFGYIVPRSSWRKRGLIAQAIIDSFYVGPLNPVVTYVNDFPTVIEKGERFAQLILVPIVTPEIKIVEEFDLPTDVRGEKGLGSTGTK